MTALVMVPTDLIERRNEIILRIQERLLVSDLGFVLDDKPSPCHIWTGPDSGTGRGGGGCNHNPITQETKMNPLLQPSSFGTGKSFKKPTASCKAKERDWPKPSSAKVGDMFYRYESQVVSIGVDEWDESLGSRLQLYCHTYEVCKVTPNGAKVLAYVGKECRYGERPVLDCYINKFAYPSKGEALLGFIARKRRQQAILDKQLARSIEAEHLAESALAKELE